MSKFLFILKQHSKQGTQINLKPSWKVMDLGILLLSQWAFLVQLVLNIEVCCGQMDWKPRLPLLCTVSKSCRFNRVTEQDKE